MRAQFDTICPAMTLPDIKEPHLRLQWAAEQAGCPKAADLFRFIDGREAESTVRSRHNGTRPMTKGPAKMYGKILGVPWLWLMGENVSDDDGIYPREESNLTGPALVAVAGYVGAGAEVYPFDDHALGDGLEMVLPPPGVDASTVVAVKVRGDSMYPALRDGWILFYTRSCDGVLDECINAMCVCQIENGPTCVKDVRRGSDDGTFTLLSSNAPPIENVRLSWAAKVRDIRLP